MNTKEVWVAYSNTDLTEGHGGDIPIAVCALEITALRLAKGKYVQGSTAPVEKMVLIEVEPGKWFLPVKGVHITPPSSEDVKAHNDAIRAQAIRDAKDEVLKKAAAAGLTEDDLAILKMLP